MCQPKLRNRHVSSLSPKFRIFTKLTYLDMTLVLYRYGRHLLALCLIVCAGLTVHAQSDSPAFSHPYLTEQVEYPTLDSFDKSIDFENVTPIEVVIIQLVLDWKALSLDEDRFSEEAMRKLKEIRKMYTTPRRYRYMAHAQVDEDFLMS